MNESIDEINLEDVVKFLWKIRKLIIVGVLALILFMGGNFAFNVIRSHGAANNDFSSANLDRISRGIYRLRVEVFGELSNIRREDTPVDFYRDLKIIIHKENGLLSFVVTNEREDIVIERVRMQGTLRNRGSNDYHLIDTTHENINLRYNESSSGIPISIFQTTENHVRIGGSREWLRNIEEFRNDFELEFLGITFFMVDDWDNERNEAIAIRYFSSDDSYRIWRDNSWISYYDWQNRGNDEYDEDGDEDGDENGDEDEDLYENDNLELSSNPEDVTTVEMYDHVADTQVFNIVTELDGIVLRIEHSGENWIDTPFYNVFDDVFEEILEVDENGVAELSVSAANYIDAIFINDVEVEHAPFEYGFQHFIFNVEFE